MPAIFPPKCFYGHVLGVEMLRRFEGYEKIPGLDRFLILDMLGLFGKERECCRSIVHTTMDVEEKINMV